MTPLRTPRPSVSELDDEALRPTELERVLDLLSLLGLLAMVAALVWLWPRLPQTVAIHFDLAGRPDGWGPRAWVLLLPALGAALHFGFRALERRPDIFNYPWAITRENAVAQYRLAREVMVVTRATYVWVLAVLLWNTFAAAQGRPAPWVGWSALALVGLHILYLGLYFLRARQLR